MAATPDLIARGLGATDAELFGERPVRYRVFVRDYRYLRVAELTDWTHFSFVRRFNGIGSWVLETSAESREARLLLKHGGIVVTRTVNGVAKTIFSGFVATDWSWTARTFRAGGLSDDARLGDVLARPEPARDTGPYSVDAYVATAQASTAMRELVRVQMGEAAPGLWNNVPVVLGPDPLAGAVVTIRGNLQPVLTILQELAADPQSGGLGFSLLQSDSQAGKLEFRVFVPQDRSAQAKFSVGLNTISDYDDAWTAPDGNYFVVMGGDGYGRNRTLVEGQDDESVLETGRRTARVIDKRGTTDVGELQQALAEAIAGAQSSRRVALTPFDVPSLQFGVHYDFGDLVTVVSHAGEQIDLIRSVEVTLDPEHGPHIVPLVGEGGGQSETERTARYIASVQDRLSNLERNWTTPPDSVDRSMLVPVLKPPIGEVKWLAGAAVPTGYLRCDGTAVSRSTYSLLFAAIGTTWGPGDGSTTFNLPNLLDRVALGAGGSYALGATGGSATAAGPPHTHPGSHSHGNSHSHAGAPHTHPGSHSHGPGTLAFQHDHSVNLDHDHPVVSSGKRNTDSVGALGFNEPAASSGTLDHHHNVDVPTLGATWVTTTGWTNVTKSGATDTDSNAPAASYSGGTGLASPASTDADSNVFAAAYSGQISLMQPFAGLNPCIYTGA